MATETEERTRLYEERDVPGDSLAARVARSLRTGPTTEKASLPAKAEGGKAETEKPAAKPAEPIALEEHRPESPGLTAENLTDFYDRLKEAARAATAPWATRYEEATKEGEATRKSVVLPALEGERAAATVPPPPLPRLAGSPPPPPIQPRRFLDGGSQNAIRAIVNGLGLIAQMFAGAKAPVAALGAVTGAMRGWAEGDDVRADAAWRQYLIEVERIKSDNAQALEAWQAAMRASGMSLDQAKARATVALQEAGLSDHAAEVALRGMEAAGKQFDREASLARGLYDDTIKLMKIQSTEDLKREIIKSTAEYRKSSLALKEREVVVKEKEASSQMTPDELETLARAYAPLGKTPAFGMGRSADRINYYKTVARLAPEYGGPQGYVMRQLALHGLGTEYAGLAKLKGLAEAWEGTARANLKMAVEASEKVPRTKIPLLNKFLLSAGKEGAGDPDIAAFAAAMQVGKSETSRLLQSVTGAGGVVSDSMRHEIDGILNTSMTHRQVMAVFEALSQDMTNRHNSYTDEANAVQREMERMAGPVESGQEIVSPDGKFIWRGGKWESR